MFQVYIGPRPGRTDEIVDMETQALAEQVARERVSQAKQSNQSMIATVFSSISGIAVSVFATPNLSEPMKKFKRVEIV